MATADEEAMEGCRGGLQVGEAKSPFGTVSMGYKSRGLRPGVPAHGEGRVRGHSESAPRGWGEEQI